MSEEARLRDVAARFTALWQVLDGAPDSAVLRDRVRDALDRRTDRLDPGEATLIAGSWWMDERVHEGPLTEIWQVRHRDLDLIQALKVLRPDRADDVVGRRLLLREAQLAGDLRHPHVAAPRAVLRLADGRPALVLDWLPHTLAGALDRCRFAPEEVRAVATALLTGLAAIHADGLVHADIAPENLLMPATDDYSRLRIADFGLAVRVGEAHGALDLRAAGRPGFSAPEQRDGAALDGRTDLFACGRVIEAMLARCDGPCGTLARLAASLTRVGSDQRPPSALAALTVL